MSQGLLTRNDLRSTAWRNLFRDVYADALLPVSHRDRCRAVTRWLVPPGTAVAGRSAAALYRVGKVEPREPVDVLVPTVCGSDQPSRDALSATGGEPELLAPTTRGTRVGARRGPASGLRVHRAEVDPDDVCDQDGLLVTTVPRTCWDVSGWLDVVEAVVILDGLLARRLVGIPALREYALARAGRRGWRSLLRAVDLADAGAESPQESRTRARLVLAGLPRPQTQWVVADGTRFVARLDLAWPEFKVAVEYDGLWHDDAEQFHRDRRRLNQLIGGDWIVLHVTGKRLREDFEGFLAEVRAALRARGHRGRT
ncbi:endonuclease domain-containing protein [Micromonospora siamensis]|uniref:Very-short-patch-repair endonuclease n=1 Tax=Micromonospora siamensis TaxID=299152 RepID=A0A1C5I020_9ACTN|nr:hypothetical protein [Micromonospora siamensis]SCG51553.1 hypothetical protein GA0074704_2661 [Micromonospora siamensis]